jgi:hypothetical protein
MARRSRPNPATRHRVGNTAGVVIGQLQLAKQRRQRRPVLAQLRNQRVNHRLAHAAFNDTLGAALARCQVIDQVDFGAAVLQNPQLIWPKLVLRDHFSPKSAAGRLQNRWRSRLRHRSKLLLKIGKPVAGAAREIAAETFLATGQEIGQWDSTSKDVVKAKAKAMVQADNLPLKWVEAAVAAIGALVQP